MELRRFFIDNADLVNGVAVIYGDEFYHATKVLRLKNGFKIIVATGDGFDYLCEIISIEKDCLKAKVIETKKNAGMPNIEVTLFQAVIKGGKSDIVVQKATELGASEIELFYSDNTSEKDVNTDRLNKVALEAAKQCHRSSVPIVKMLNNFAEVVKNTANYDLIIMAYEFEDKTSIREILTKNSGAKKVAVIVGSEGGFSEKEANLARSCGISTVSLGKRILRAETAAISTLTLVMYELGEMSV